MAVSWAARRDNRATGAPLASAEMDSTVKHVDFPTLDKTAISRLEPLIQGAMTSWRGICPSTLPRRMWRVWFVSQRCTGASRMERFSMASRRSEREKVLEGRSPSGGKRLFSGIIDRILSAAGSGLT